MCGEMYSLCGVLKWWPQVGNSLRTGASLTKCCQSLEGFSVMLNSNLFVGPVVINFSQTTSRDQHVAFLNRDGRAGLCLFINTDCKSFIVFKKKKCAHMLSCEHWGGTSSVNVNCATSIYELDVGVMNVCFFAALRARFRDGKPLLFFCSVNCNKMFQHVQNNIPSRWSEWLAFQPWTNVEGNHIRISAVMRHHFFACTCDWHKGVATTS